MLITKLPNQTAMPAKVSIAVWLLVLLPAALALSCRHQPQPEKTVAPTPTPQQSALLYPTGFGPAVKGKPYPGTGIVTVVNRKEGWVEIKHEEIKDLMPAMTMEFWVRNAAHMKGIQVGDKVDFLVVDDDKGEYLTKLKKVVVGR